MQTQPQDTFDARKELVEDIAEVLEEAMADTDGDSRTLAAAIAADLAEQLPAFDSYVRAAYLEQRAHGGLSVEQVQSGRVALTVRSVEKDFEKAVEALGV